MVPLTVFHFTLLHFTVDHFILLQFPLFHCTSFHFTSLYFTSLYFTSLYMIKFTGHHKIIIYSQLHTELNIQEWFDSTPVQHYSYCTTHFIVPHFPLQDRVDSSPEQDEQVCCFLPGRGLPC